MWHANEASSHHASFGRTSGITNTRMPPLQISGHCRARPKYNAVLSTRPTASRYIAFRALQSSVRPSDIALYACYGGEQDRSATVARGIGGTNLTVGVSNARRNA